jgi:hypothetical protein
MGYKLNPEERRRYEEEGLVIPGTSLSPQLFAKVKSAVEAMIDDNGKVRREFTLVAHVPPRGDNDGTEGAELIFKIATSKEVLDLVEQVLGPDIILWGSSIFAKPAGVGKKVQWHQDSRWWPMRPIINCTMWIAVDDSSPENGCLRYIPGSHRWEIMPHLDETEQGLLGASIAENLFRQEDTRDIVLKAGKFSLHQANLVHGSEPNISPKRRTGLVLRYMPASSFFDRSDAKHIEEVGVMKTGDIPRYGHRPIWLVRGQNRHPGNDFRIGHEHLEDLDQAAGAAREGNYAQSA